MRASLVSSALRYADQVARSGSIQRAAKELNVAASAINRQILNLERDLEVTLFERLSSGMRLTPAGEALVTLARRWRTDENRAYADLKQLKGLSQGHVRMAAMDSHANGFLSRFAGTLLEDHPRISLEIQIASPGDAQAALLSGEIDLIAAFNLSPHRALHVLWQRELPFGCIVAPRHTLAGRKTVSMQEVVAHPIALQSRTLPIRHYLETRHGWLFTGGQKMVETNSLQLVKSLVCRGTFVAFTSELDAAPELASGTLIFIPVRDKGVDPQTVGIAIDGRKPLSKISKIVADQLAKNIDDELSAVRGMPARDGAEAPSDGRRR